MKKLMPLFLIIILFTFSASAFSYDIQIIGDIPVSDNLTGISVNPSTGIAAAVSGETKTLYLIDTNSNTVVKKIPLDIMPSGVAIDPKRNVVVISSLDGALIFIDLDLGTVVNTISLGKPIYSIAVGKDSDTLFIGTGDGFLLLNLEIGKIVKEASFSDKIIGMDIDNNLGYLVVITEGKDSVSLYDINTLEQITGKSSPLEKGDEGGCNSSPSGIAVNPSTHIAVRTNNSDNSISIVSLENRTSLTSYPLNFSPSSLTIDPTRNIAFIIHKGGIAIVKLENPAPAIEKLVPENSQAGSPGFTLSIKGSRFIRESRARFNLRELDTLFEDTFNLKALVPSEELLSPMDIPVSVSNPLPGGGISNTLIFKILNPVPQLESLTPDTVALNNPPLSPLNLRGDEKGVTSPPLKIRGGRGCYDSEGGEGCLRIRGKNFLPKSVVNLNGRNLKTKFISSILLEAQLDFTDIKTPASYPVTVINPMPESFTSNVVFLNVVEDASSITTVKENEIKEDQSIKETGTLTGRILNTQKEPIEGVGVQIRNIRTETDSNGNFILNNVPSGKNHLMIHGSTAKEPGSHYPTIPLSVDIQPNIINQMPFQIYLHRQKNYNFKDINPEEDTILTDPEVPGFELRIPKGVKITGWDGQTNLKVSVRPVPTDRLPVKPLPDNANVRTVYMFYFDKIGGGVPDQPIPIKSPNNLGLLPGEKAVLWYYDESPNEGEAPNDWAIAGTGTVTPDGMYIVTDPGFGIPKFCCGAITWGSPPPGGPPPSPPPPCTGACCPGTGGDPVDLATGTFIYSKTDLHIPGIIPVNITRYYRAGDTNAATFGRSTYFEYDWWLGAYDANGNLNDTNPTMLLLITPGNHQARFAKQPDGTFINATDPEFRGAIITYNSSDSSRTLKMRDGTKYKFIYGGNWSGELIEIEDRNGNKLTFTRLDRNGGDDLGGYIKEIHTPEGRKITFSHTLTQVGGIYRTDSITDDAGRSVTYSYETDPFSSYTRLNTVTYPDGSQIQYQYDTSGRLWRIINQRGFVEVENEYYPDDPNDVNKKFRVYKQTHSDEGTFTFNYVIAGGNITETSMTAPNGSITTWRFYDDSGAYRDGYITKQMTLDGTTTYELEAGTNLKKSVTDPLGRTMNYTYYSNGLVQTMTDNLNNTTSYEYEPTYGLPTKITDALGNITTMTYDTSGNMLTRTGPDGKTTSFTYNSTGKPLTVTDALNNVTTMQYDSSGNLIKVTDPLGNFSSMTYDNLGRMTTMTDAKGRSTSYTYDVMGTIGTVTDPMDNNTHYFYDVRGKLTTVLDAKGNWIWYEYDNRDRVTKMTDQLGNTETYIYDTSDNLTSVTDRKGQVTTYTYDLMNRVTRIDYSDGSYTTYAYDAVGKVLSITDSVSGTTSYTYTGTGCGTGCGAVMDKIASETTPLGTFSYTYDNIGRKISMIISGQPAVNYGYDENSRLTNIDTLINGVAAGFSLRYDDLGRRTSLTLPNGVTTNYTYDNGSHLLNLEHLNSAQQILESLTYSYDATGNRTSMNRQSVNLPLRDPVTNTSYNNANQMLTFNDKNLVYDANGNLISMTNGCGTTTYTWDVRNRLVGIIGFKPNCSALTASFVYDVLGRRTQKTINGRRIQYVYEGLDIVQEIENGQVTVNYIRTLNIDEPLVRVEASGGVRYYQQDALGSVIALTDETGAIRTQYSYDPFGSVTISGEASDNPFHYTGRENDGTGLYYYRARYYSPELQRFISEDPIRFSGGDVNFYSYVKNRPTVLVDPLGLAGCGPFGMSIPDPWGLSECCDKHDDCYDKCEGRKKCDQTFCTCMQNKCSKLPPQDREKCNCRASRYCSAVKGGGGIAYFPSCGSFQ